MGNYKGVLIRIVSGQKTSSTEIIDYQLIVDFKDGFGEQEIPYSNKPGEKTGIGERVDDWLAANPTAIVVAEYVSPTTAEQAMKTRLTRRQIRQGLKNIGRGIEFLKTAIASAADADERDALILGWEESSTIGRSSAIVALMQSKVGASDAQVDTFWISWADLPK